jgi:hypothetical protein
MSTAVTAQEILDECAFRLHAPAFAAGEFVTLVDALRVLRSSLRRLSGMLASVSTGDLLARESTLTVPAGEASCTLPGDHEALRTVHWVSGSNRVELRRGHPAGKMDVDGVGVLDQTAATWVDSAPPTYWLEGDLIRFSVVPSDAQSVVITYTASLTIDDEDSVLLLGQGWEEWLVCDMCERIRGREQKDASDFRAAKAEAAAIINASVQKRDRFALHSVRDVSGDHGLRGAALRWRR